MNASDNCLKIIKDFEGCKLNAYPDAGRPSGLPITIGYGSTFNIDGTRFVLGNKINQPQAERLLAFDVSAKAKEVSKLFEKAPLTQNQFDAILDFAYNLGVGTLTHSALYKKVLVNPNDTTIPAEFAKWNHAGGRVLDGLTRRRAEEVKLYLTK